jgi:hypothetical protein
LRLESLPARSDAFGTAFNGGALRNILRDVLVVRCAAFALVAVFAQVSALTSAR